MKKERKSRDYYTISVELYKRFIDYVEKNNLNKSKLIEKKIKDYMKKIIQN